MENINCLTELPNGCCAVVRELKITGGMRRRLQDMGLIEGTCVECVQSGPLDGLSAFLIRGAVIALRPEYSACVLVQPI